MELDSYRREALGHCQELVSELREFGVDRLHTLCCNLGAERFHDYLTQNAGIMAVYIAETPSKRKKLHRKLTPDNRAIFVLGALYHARLGWEMLRAICNHGVRAGLSYRHLTAVAAEASWSLLQSSPSLWPFEEEDGLPDPFSADA